jgi:uncharacterized protein (DUF427 family)
MKAIWNNEVIAESNDTILLEGNHYFPLNVLNKIFVVPSETNTTCSLKGVASYYTLNVKGSENKDAV